MKAKPVAAAPRYPAISGSRVGSASRGRSLRGALPRPSAKPSGGGGDVPIVAGILLALAALTALVVTARAGRASSE